MLLHCVYAKIFARGGGQNFIFIIHRGQRYSAICRVGKGKGCLGGGGGGGEQMPFPIHPKETAYYVITLVTLICLCCSQIQPAEKDWAFTVEEKTEEIEEYPFTNAIHNYIM